MKSKGANGKSHQKLFMPLFLLLLRVSERLCGISNLKHSVCELDTIRRESEKKCYVHDKPVKLFRQSIQALLTDAKQITLRAHSINCAFSGS